MSKKEPMCTPFSNGSEAMDWCARNCDRCTKAFHPKVDGDWPSDKTMRQYISIGKECKFKYHIDLGFIIGEIPLSIAQQMGYTEDKVWFPDCIHYSDNEDDGYKPKPRPKPDPTPPNQMVMPFIIEETLKQKEQLV